MIDNSNRLIIGLGNELRGDDALGIKVVEFLRKNHPLLAEYYTEQSDLSRLIERWAGKDIVIIDSIFTEAPEVGKIHQANFIRDFLIEREKQYSSHGLGLSDVFELGTKLNQTPRSYLLIGVEGQSWQIGSQMGVNMDAAIPKVTDLVLKYYN